MRARYLFTGVLPGLVFAAGCSIEVLEPDPPRQETVFRLDVADGPPDVWRVGGFLYAGVSADGRSRSIPDAPLRIAGTDLTPDTVLDPRGILSVRWSADITRPVTTGTMSVAPPTVEGRDPGALVFGVRPSREGRAPLRRVAGEDVVVAPGAVAPPSLAPTIEHWSLELRGWSGDVESIVTSIRVQAQLPDSIRIPGTWVPAGLDSALATLDHQRIWDWQTGDGGYRARVTHLETVLWRVVVDSAPEGRENVSSR